MPTNRGPVVALASTSRAVANYDVLVTNNECKGILVIIDTTVVGGAGTVTLSLRVPEASGGAAAAIWTSAAISAVSTVGWEIRPGLATELTPPTATAAGKYSLAVPDTFTLRFAVGTNAVTFSASYYLLV